MRNRLFFIAAALAVVCSSCGYKSYSGAYGSTNHEVYTYSTSINDYDLDVDPNGITYTIDISTREGSQKLKGRNLEQARDLALQEAAIVNNAARIVSPKFTYLKEGKDILRVTVFGFPARYKAKDKPVPSDVYIIK